MPQGPSEARSIFTSRAAMKWLTVLSLIGVTVGVIGGMLVAHFEPAGSDSAVATANALVRAWTNAFRMLVAPLVMAQLYLAVAGDRDSTVSGQRTGLAIPVVFAGLLTFCALVAFLLTPLLVELPWVSGVALTPPAGVVNAATAAASASSSAGRWVDAYIPSNIFAAATTDNILPLMLFSLVFALAMRNVEKVSQVALFNVVKAISQASFTIVGWLLLATPVIMLALGFRSAVDSGMAVGEAILGFALLEIVVVLVALLLLYPITAIIGRVPMGQLARALWPAQLTAVATRSSLATLPALMSAATTTLGLRKETVGAVIPAGGATLKLSRAISGPVKLLFLAHVLGIDITFERLVVFAITIIILSASTVGVATVTSGNRSLPAYVAAGVPAEYVALMAVAVSLTDIFLTVINASGYMSAAVIVERIGGRGRRAVPAETPPVPIPVPTSVSAPESMAGVT